MISRFPLFNLSLSLLMVTLAMTVNAEDKVMDPAKEMADKTQPMLITQEQRLATLLPDNEVMWLSSDNGKFLALKRDYLAASERGIAIFVSDIATPINHKVDIEPIRKELNLYGWTTIALQPPNPTLLNPVAEMPTLMAKKDEASSDEVMAEKPNMMKQNNGSIYAKALIERIVSAQKWAATQTKNTILILQGRQAAYITNALMQQHLHPTRAIVLIDADTAISSDSPAVYPATTSQLSMALSQVKAPLLDIYHLKNNNVKSDMLKRKKMTIRENKKNYRQFLKPTYSEEKQLAKVIYGWLKTLGIK